MKPEFDWANSQYDKPTTLADADWAIGSIRRSQAELRQRGEYAKAREWDADVDAIVAERNAIARANR